MTAAWQPPPVGWHGVVRITDGDSISTPAFRMLDDQSPYNGIPAYRISSGPSVIVYARGNGNQIAMLTPDGSKQWEMTPDEGTFSWPLFVGKTWTAKYRYHDFQTQKDFDDIEADWKVEALEDVTPSEIFGAYREVGRAVGYFADPEAEQQPGEAAGPFTRALRAASKSVLRRRLC